MNPETTQTKENPRLRTQREAILTEAHTTIVGSREDTYGAPFENFGAIADYWSTHLGSRLASPVTRADVACMLTLLKLSRLRTTPDHHDSWVDAAGYAALGGEVSNEEAGRASLSALAREARDQDRWER